MPQPHIAKFILQEGYQRNQRRLKISWSLSGMAS